MSLCKVHGTEFKLVPAGVSKTKFNEDGTPKAYDAFYACPVKSCRQKPEGSPAPSPAPKVESPDWDLIGQQKNRSNLAAAMLHSGQWDVAILNEAEKWVLKGGQKIKPKPLTDEQENEIGVEEIPF